MSGRRIEVSGTQVVASVLATVTGAIAASYLGVAGTIIGAAVMSVASTAGSAVYKHYLGRTARRLREAAPVITHRTTQRATAAGAKSTAERLFQPQPGDSERTLTSAVTDAGDALPDPGAEPRPRTRLRGKPGWLVAVGAAAGIFLTVIAAITVFELAAGKPLEAVVFGRHSSGTSVGQIVGVQGGKHAKAPAAPRTQPATPAGGASSTPASPSASPSPSPSPTSSSGSPSPSPSPTGSDSATSASTATTKS